MSVLDEWGARIVRRLLDWWGKVKWKGFTS